MKYFCSYCGKEFELNKTQRMRINENPKARIFCSRSCSAKYKRQKVKENLQTLYICTNCNKSFEADYRKALYWKNNKNNVINHFCSEDCKQEYKNKRHKTNIEKRVEKKREYDKNYRLRNYENYLNYEKEYYKKNIQKRSIDKYGISDFAPNQHGLEELNTTEKLRYANLLMSAQPQNNKNNKYSNRKGVCYLEDRNKWRAYLYKDGHNYSKSFDTENEAVEYRIHLENIYYTPEQLAIRDKYSKEDK